MEGQGQKFWGFSAFAGAFLFSGRVFALLPGSDILPPQSATSAKTIRVKIPRIAFDRRCH
jgi:hypothetical protein